MLLLYKRMYDQLERVGMEVDIACLEILGIGLEELNKTMKTFIQGRRYPG
jgi:hypothetical protein